MALTLRVRRGSDTAAWWRGRRQGEVEGIDRFGVADHGLAAQELAAQVERVRVEPVPVDGLAVAAADAVPLSHGWHRHVWHGPGMVRRALHGGRRAPLATVLGFAVVVGVVGPMLWARLYAHADFRMVDLAVYRAAGQSLLQGRPLYGYLTPVPQLLPFTYPPFSALIALVLAPMSSQAANWVWTLGTLAVLAWLVMVGFRPFVRRFPATYRPLVVGCLLAAAAWVEPVRDCFRYGQVGIFLAALCVLDCASPRTRWPRGMLVGFAAAVKLVPAVFIPYLWFTGRRRAAVVAAAWFAGFSIASAIAMPSASKVYWTSALFDSNRLGSNSGASNQSIRGIFLRWLPGNIGSALWIISVIAIALAGYRWARSASFGGREVRGIAIVGLLSVLISPVSWIHHLAGWVPLSIGVLLGDGRSWRRVSYAVVATVFFSLQLPWWGAAMADTFPHLHLLGRLIEDAFAFGALFAVWLLGRMDVPNTVRTPSSREPRRVPS